MGGVGAGKNHGWTRGYLQVEFVENTLIFIEFTQTLIKIVCHVENLHGALGVSHIPNLHCKIVARENVVIAARCKLRSCKGANNVCKKVALGTIFFLLESQRVFLDTSGLSQVADANVSLTRGVDKLVRVVRMELCISYYFWQVSSIWRLDINQTVSCPIILHIP